MTGAPDRRRGNPRVFKGAKAKLLRAALKRMVAERERKTKPKDQKQ